MASGLMSAKETIHDSTNECEDLAESFPGVWDAFFFEGTGGSGGQGHALLPNWGSLEGLCREEGIGLFVFASSS